MPTTKEITEARNQLLADVLAAPSTTEIPSDEIERVALGIRLSEKANAQNADAIFTFLQRCSLEYQFFVVERAEFIANQSGKSPSPLLSCLILSGNPSVSKALFD